MEERGPVECEDLDSRGYFSQLFQRYSLTLRKSFDLVEAPFLTFNGDNNAHSTQSDGKTELISQAL